VTGKAKLRKLGIKSKILQTAFAICHSWRNGITPNLDI